MIKYIHVVAAEDTQRESNTRGGSAKAPASWSKGHCSLSLSSYHAIGSSRGRDGRLSDKTMNRSSAGYVRSKGSLSPSPPPLSLPACEQIEDPLSMWVSQCLAFVLQQMFKGVTLAPLSLCLPCMSPTIRLIINCIHILFPRQLIYFCLSQRDTSCKRPKVTKK